MKYGISAFKHKYSSYLPPEAIEELSKIEETEMYYRNAFNHSPCTISILDKDGKYLQVNPKLLRDSNQDESFFLGKVIGSHTESDTVLKLIQEMNLKQESEKFQILQSSLNNKVKYFLITINRIGDKFLVIGSDVTEVRELEDKKTFNEKMSFLGEMSSFIVHEINNPLYAITLANEVIRMNTKDEEITGLSNDIEELIETINKIIQSLKVFARNSTNEKTTVCVQDLFNKTKVILGGKLKKLGVGLDCENLDNKTMEGSEVDFLQCLVNAISNGIDAVKDLDEKWVKVKFENGIIRIIDSGNGIPKAIENKMFEKFFTSKGNEGNGVGLYLSRTLLNKWGYELTYSLEAGHTSFNWVPASVVVPDSINLDFHI